MTNNYNRMMTRTGYRCYMQLQVPNYTCCY